jgi:lipid-binding SYLF domain-containing protein
MFLATRVRVTLLLAGLVFAPMAADAKSAAELDRQTAEALRHLIGANDAARSLAREARAILVFPNIVKGGFLFGGSFGEGALRVGEHVEGYYRTVSASYGLQAGIQSYGYALFFMNDSALDYFRKSEGWEVGVGPTLVIADEGLAASLSTTTARSDVYAFFFDQQGLMAGIGLQGTKIFRIHPK